VPGIDLNAIPPTNSTSYPPDFAGVVAGRWYRRLAPAAGLEDFGISHVTSEPGAWSSQRHWHEGEDEFVVVLSGEAWLVEDGGEAQMRAGDCAAFPKNSGNGHVLQNRSNASCVLLAIGRPAASDCHYPDIDLHLAHGRGFVRKDNTQA